jgi:HEAT repeat protein
MPERIEQLLNNLIDQDAPIPIESLHELSDLDSQQMAFLSQRWTLIDLEKRRVLIKDLGQLADDNIELTFEVINKFALNDQDPEVRQTAINNLWESEDPSLITAFIQALETDPSESVRAAAATALGSFVLLAETEDIKPSLQLDLEEALLHSVNIEKNETIRRSCLESLGFSSRKEVEPLILEAYQSDQEDMKKSALLAMGRSANKKWREMVVSELHNPLPNLRFVAAEAAGELEIRAAMDDLIELLDDVNQDVKHAAIWSISQIGGPPATDALTSLFDLSDDEEETQLIQDALDNLAFVNDTRDMLLFDVDEYEDFAS